MLVLSAVSALAIASPASGGTKCGEKVFLDWYDNGRIDRLYPLNCYEEAFDEIPDDIRDYSSAEEVITRALQAALNGNLAPGGPDPTPNDDSGASGSDGGSDDGTAGGTGGSDGNPQAAPGVDTSGPSSIPIPLLVLGGMSIALLAAGGLGYLSRRRQAAGDASSPDDPAL